MQLFQAQENLDNCESNANDLDLYHSVIRFLRYSYKVVDCKRSILESRILIYICRAIYKYNKHLTFPLEGPTASAGQATSIPVEQTETTTTPAPLQIFINPKSLFLCKDLIKHYLIMLENWPKPICSEFYNQATKNSFW